MEREAKIKISEQNTEKEKSDGLKYQIKNLLNRNETVIEEKNELIEKYAKINEKKQSDDDDRYRQNQEFKTKIEFLEANIEKS